MYYNKFKTLIKGLGLLTVLVAVFIVSPLSAQDVSTGQAKANVLAVLVVTSEADIEFGDVMQGVPKIADKTSLTAAGRFKIVGEEGKEVSVFMQLPDYLWNDSTAAGGASDEDRMVVAFSTTDADLAFTDASTPAVHGANAITDQDPHNLSEVTLGNGNVGEQVCWIFMGGRVFPTVDQRTGVYSADIVLTAAYTGN